MLILCPASLQHDLKTYRILLTNDDGVNSPALEPTIDSIFRLEAPPFNLKVNLEVIVPKNEQSWIAKKVSIRDRIRVEKNVTVGHHAVTTLTGTPADCVNYGIYRSKKKPHLVVSGMNVGSNTSLGHHLSSGTVGGAVEGVIAGVRSIAVSAPYANEPRTPDSFAKALEIFPKLMYHFLLDPPTGIKMLSVNIPLSRTSNYYLPVFLERKTYGAIFEEVEEGILAHRHMKNLVHPDDLTLGSDRWARAYGIPTALPIDHTANPIPPSSLQKWLAKHNLNHRLREEELNFIEY
ncbi:MAG: 5'/3'-nucleotidase SurE [Methanobacteriota archaeon]|nr:MAG: 5'/3'-nucleotidase SurE [Euryarchaeota archaeon]